MTKVAIMLGGNLPGTPLAMKKALKLLEKSGFHIDSISADYLSAAVDCLPETPDFIDRAITGRWAASPEALLDLCQHIERLAGRPASHRSCESRILDCDIILFGEYICNTHALTIPHPRAAQRRFVLEPLASIAGEWNFPGKNKSVAELLKEL